MADRYEPCPICDDTGKVPSAFYGQSGPPVTCRTCGGSRRSVVGERVAAAAVERGDPLHLSGV